MAQRFLAPELIAEGVIKQKGTVSHDEHLITRGYLHSNVLNGIHPDSANYLEVVADGGVNKLKVKPLTVTDVTVDATQTSLANFISNVYTGSNFQEGDIVFLAATSPIESYIHNGGTAGTAADWELINSGLSDAQIRAKFSASSGIDYNASTGEFTADQTEIKGFFSAGTGLAYLNGQFSLSATSDQITEGSNNLFYTNARVDGHLSGGTAIQYNAGVISFNGSTSDVAEGSNLYYTNARVDAHLSGGTAIQYNAGVISFNGDSDDVVEGTTNRYYSSSLVYGDLGVATAPTNDQQMISFNSSTGEYSLLRSEIGALFSAGTGLSFQNGQYSFVGNTDIVSEGTNNLYFSQQRARQSIQADPAAGNLLTVNQTSGDIALMTSSIRKTFFNQSLTANTALNLSHNFGERLVHVSAMTGSGDKVELEITYANTNQVTVKSLVSLTGIDILVSL